MLGGMKTFIAFLLLLALASAAPAAPAAPELSADAAQRDLRLLRRAFVDLHPGLTRYASLADLDARFATAQAEVAGGASRAQLYLLATRLAAQVRCGHTWTNPSNQSPAVQQLLGAATLPLAFRFVEGRLRVEGSAVPAVPVGSEVLTLEGRTPGEITALLMPYLRADGSSDGKRLAQLDDDPNGGALQRLLPLLVPPAPEGWRLQLADGRTVRVPPMTAAAREQALRASGWQPASTAWQLRIDGDVAVLTLPTFAFWGGGFDGVAFLARSFDELQERGIRRLVVDLRSNEGGDDGLGRALLAHLLKTPYTPPTTERVSAYERVPYGLARYLDTWDFDFFDRTGQVQRLPGRGWRLPDSPGRVITPVARPFEGRVVALVGPQNSSAGYLLARDLKATGAALLMGEPTGGNLRGLNGGQLAWLTLPGSGVAVDIPLVANFTPGDPPDAGVQPDVLVAPRWADVAAGVDTALQAARQRLSAY
jgi:hypothetical protein